MSARSRDPRGQPTRLAAPPKGLHDSLAFLLRRNRYIDTTLATTAVAAGRDGSNDGIAASNVELDAKRKLDILDFLPSLFRHVRPPHKRPRTSSFQETDTRLGTPDSESRLTESATALDRPSVSPSSATTVLVWHRPSGDRSKPSNLPSPVDSTNERQAEHAGEASQGNELSGNLEANKSKATDAMDVDSREDDLGAVGFDGTTSVEDSSENKHTERVENAAAAKAASSTSSEATEPPSKADSSTGKRQDKQRVPTEDRDRSSSDPVKDEGQQTVSTNKADVLPSTSTSKPATRVRLDPVIYSDTYRNELRQVQHDIRALRRRRDEIMERQVELWGTYQYGLYRIAKLSNLADAPDAVLSGNFCSCDFDPRPDIDGDGDGRGDEQSNAKSSKKDSGEQGR